jgi:hypothetical protein
MIKGSLALLALLMEWLSLHARVAYRLIIFNANTLIDAEI